MTSEITYIPLKILPGSILVKDDVKFTVSDKHPVLVNFPHGICLKSTASSSINFFVTEKNTPVKNKYYGGYEIKIFAGTKLRLQSLKADISLDEDTLFYTTSSSFYVEVPKYTQLEIDGIIVIMQNTMNMLVVWYQNGYTRNTLQMVKNMTPNPEISSNVVAEINNESITGSSPTTK